MEVTVKVSETAVKAVSMVHCRHNLVSTKYKSDSGDRLGHLNYSI